MMAAVRDLEQAVHQASVRAGSLLPRLQALGDRVLKLVAAPQPSVDDVPALDQLEELLRDIGESRLDRFQAAIVPGVQSLEAVAASIGRLAGVACDLPETLREAAVGKLECFAGEVEQKIGSMIDDVEEAFVMIEEKVRSGIAEVKERIEALATQVSEQVQAALDEVGQVLQRARQDVDRIISALERTRETVLTACRLAGIGAEAARPAVELTVEAFATVA